MPLKLSEQELLILMRFASGRKPLNIRYTGDGVWLANDRGSWAHQIVEYLRMVAKLKAEGLTDEQIFRPLPPDPAPAHIIVNLGGLLWVYAVQQ